MAIVNPPGFLQNAGTVHTAEITRNAIAGISGGRLAAGSLKPRGGVLRDLGTGMQVVEQGVPSMDVTVYTGVAFVPGSEGTKQGLYSVVNDADVTLAISAAHATLNRIDLVVVKVQDSAYSGGTDTASLVVVTGTPASSPAAPAAPANSLTLAQISIPATDTTINTAQITDKRTYLAAPGGIIYCVSTARPDTATLSSGQVIYETDTKRFNMLDGSSWVWPMARGIVGGQRYNDGTGTIIGGGGIGPSETLVGMSTGSLTLEANRRFKVRVLAWALTATAADVEHTLRVRETNLAGAVRGHDSRAFGRNSATITHPLETYYETGSADETKTFVVTAQQSSGVANHYHGDDNTIVGIFVEDIGPSGKITVV